MKALFVYLEVKPDHIDEFIAASMFNHINSIKEAGNIRFDFLRDTENPCKFSLYEIWESDEALAIHKETEHYKKWAAVLPDALAAPRYKNVYEVMGLTSR